jgi:hypothetical protein
MKKDKEEFWKRVEKNLEERSLDSIRKAEETGPPALATRIENLSNSVFKNSDDLLKTLIANLECVVQCYKLQEDIANDKNAGLLFKEKAFEKLSMLKGRMHEEVREINSYSKVISLALSVVYSSERLRYGFAATPSFLGAEKTIQIPNSKTFIVLPKSIQINRFGHRILPSATSISLSNINAWVSRVNRGEYTRGDLLVSDFEKVDSSYQRMLCDCSSRLLAVSYSDLPQNIDAGVLDRISVMDEVLGEDLDGFLARLTTSAWLPDAWSVSSVLAVIQSQLV